MFDVASNTAKRLLMAVVLASALAGPSALLIALVPLDAFAIYRIEHPVPVAASSAVARGRLVFDSEGCTHCHSLNGRPVTDRVLGPDPANNHDEPHPVAANRRQGPDLTQVGARRSPLWLKMHLYNPREVSGSSIMPSYASLFRDRRGNDLVAYLGNLRAPVASQNIADEQRWHLSAEFLASANLDDGSQLYNQYCATCHNPNGRTRLKWQSEFIESPAILTAGAMQAGSAAKPDSARTDHFAQIIKFGIPDSDMAGHENLPDKDIASLSSWLAQNTAQSAQKH
jgi:cytochrome c oxidase cbb3-type subunit 2